MLGLSNGVLYNLRGSGDTEGQISNSKKVCFHKVNPEKSKSFEFDLIFLQAFEIES